MNIRNRLFILLQSILPQHFLSQLMGKIAESPHVWLKNKLIQQFMRQYPIKMQEALLENLDDYPTFNSFFIRQLKPHLRPIASGMREIASPVDGMIAQIGYIKHNQLLQAKQFYFDLETLLGNDTTLAQTFYDGSLATLYLAPYDYHRVHMPLTGVLKKTIYVPGKLFSVNRITSELVPHLYSRNERLICLFDTDAGPMIVILIGAMIVGSIQTVWMNKPIRESKAQATTFTHEVKLAKGDELGYFKMGSTVLLLFAKDKIKWQPTLSTNALVQMGCMLGEYLN